MMPCWVEFLGMSDGSNDIAIATPSSGPAGDDNSGLM
jgi:hypothetical protein